MAALPDGWIFIPVTTKGPKIELKERELVMCKHCKNYWEGYCNRGLAFGPVAPDWYCAGGERDYQYAREEADHT